MKDNNEEILMGLMTAIEAEMTGHQFYKNAAKSTEDPTGKETFSKMAEEELKHFNYLRHQYKSVMENGAYDFSKKLDIKSFNHSESPIFSDELKDRLKDAHFEISALTIGMKLEMDAMNFYRSCAEKAQTEEAKAFYKNLADWEQDHYRAFQRQLDALKEEYFSANNFVPM